MSLRETDGLPGPPWDRPLAGSLDRLVIESDVLDGNPLGDPSRRPLYVYRPPGVEAGQDRRLPSVCVIQGFIGQLDMWLSRSAFEPTFIERLDTMFAAGECPDAVIVLRSMRRIYLDAGRGDEWCLDLRAQAFATELHKLGATYTLELFEGTHGGLTYRYPRAIGELVVALS
jgi:hypothetical protein